MYNFLVPYVWLSAPTGTPMASQLPHYCYISKPQEIVYKDTECKLYERNLFSQKCPLFLLGFFKLIAQTIKATPTLFLTHK